MTEQILLIALIQGITEFLPISSSGHLNLLYSLNQFDDPGLAMDVAVHLGTLIAVIVYNFTDLRQMTFALLTLGRHNKDQFRIAVAAIIATVPIVVVGYILNSQGILIDFLRNIEIVAWATLIFGIFLGIADRQIQHRRLTTINAGDAIVIGLAQIFALIPGASRAGVTITAARGAGLSRRAATRFSMITSIPVILGAGLLKANEILAGNVTELLMPMLAASFLSMIVALLAIGIMMAVIKRVGFMPFVIYRISVGAALLAVVYFL